MPVRAGSSAAAAPLAPEIGFLLHNGASYPALRSATERARGSGVAAHRCLIAAGAMTERDFARRLAAEAGVPLIEAAAPDARTDIAEAMRQGWFRGRLSDGRAAMIVAADGAVTPAMLRLGSGRRHVALATGSDFQRMLRDGLAGRLARLASTSVRAPESARHGMTARQRTALLAAALAFSLALVLAPGSTVTLAPVLLGVFFLGATIFQLGACFEGRRGKPPRPPAAAELPTYSVLAPLHREAGIVGQLISALCALQYPSEKLQILLVVEEHDRDTQQAILDAAPPPHIRMFVAPDGKPRTKPRALNAAMPFVTGEYVVVYDAEDRPDPDQLLLAAAVFARAPAEVACLQARLVVDNVADGPLTRMFGIEYAALFDVIKSGCARLGFPIPLGGTSNHFRTAVLRELGMWDAWNVTEDADLGYRLARHGYRVDDLDSDTLEEMPASLPAWMAQRTRWLKGWLQTIITHSRHPVATWRAMGTANFLAAVSASAGVIVGTLFTPLFVLTTIWRVSAADFLAGTSPLTIFADAMMVVLGAFGVTALYAPAIIASRRCTPRPSSRRGGGR